MTGTQTLIARGVLGVVAAASAFLAVSIPRFQAGTARTFNRCAMAVFAITRLGIYLATYFLLHIAPRGDIPSYYLTEAQSALLGQLPYRDFPSSYAPMHPYLDGLVIFFWRSSLPIILFAILAEALLLWVWLPLGRIFLSERRVRIATILYLASPLSLQFVAIDGQDNVIIALLVALAILLLIRKREAFSGIAVAAAIVFIKFLPLLFIPPFFSAARQRMRWLLGCAVTLLVGYGVFACLHLPLLSPLLGEGHIVTAGNLPYVVESVLGIALPHAASDGLLVLLLLLLFAVVARAMRGADLPARMRIVTFATAAITLTLLIFAKKSWPPYLLLALFPICLSFTERAYFKLRVAAFCLFSVVALVEHSLWSSILAQALAPDFHNAIRAAQPTALLLLLLELLLIAGYIWLLYEALHQILTAQNPQAPQPRELAE